ncbi:hypothetical protein QL285_050673 [Trifolium repens]|nr:hypothetical protein QL285_050673 [Trifolium repens]
MPPSFWVKYNNDGASRGSLGISPCGGIFRDHLGTILGAFSANIGVATSLYAAICAAIYAIEFAYARGWTNIWLECDSLLSVQAFTNVNVVPWKLKGFLHLVLSNSLYLFGGVPVDEPDGDGSSSFVAEPVPPDLPSVDSPTLHHLSLQAYHGTSEKCTIYFFSGSIAGQAPPCVRILLDGGSSNNFIQMEKIPKRKSQSSRWVNNEWDQLTFFLLLHVPTRLQVAAPQPHVAAPQSHAQRAPPPHAQRAPLPDTKGILDIHDIVAIDSFH